MELTNFVNSELKSVEEGKVKECLKKLMIVFSKQDHSNMSASIVRSLFVFNVKDDPDSIDKSLFTKDGDFYGGMTGNALKELSESLKECNLSDEEKTDVLKKFNRLSSHRPLTSLTFKDDEWNDIGSGSFQNTRNPSVFKEGKNGRPYTIDAYYMKNQDNGTYTGSLETPNGKIKRCYIKDRSNMPQVCIDVIDREVNKDNENIKEPGSGWWVEKIKNPEQLKELEKYYNVEYWKE